jgi:dTDP-4-dehydrorhamnose 3,5-epimerase
MTLRFEQTPLPGAFVIETEAFADARGSFARVFSLAEFAAAGLETQWRQISASQNVKRGTLRGLHFQRPPHEETKLVRCERGRIYDVIVDLRGDSPVFGQWFGIELRGEDARSVYVPQGLAHGFLTLEDDSVVGYHISADFAAEAAGGLRWDDPEVGVDWPFTPATMSERDRALPRLTELGHDIFCEVS